jgi:hypothetical protein
MEDHMSSLDNTPENKNFLSPLNFRFQIKKAPHVNFFLQKVNLSDIAVRNADTPSPFVKTPLPGDHIDYGLLTISFKVDEDLSNYLEIHEWLRAFGRPENFEDYKKLASFASWTADGIYSDISLIVLSSTHMPNYDIVYVDAFPITLSGLNFSTSDTDVNYIEASATFKYSYYTISKIK